MQPRLARRAFLQSLALASGVAGASKPDAGWMHYGGGPGVTRYSPLAQIRKDNVRSLRPAWVHACGDSMSRPATTIEAEPLVAGGMMYVTTPQVKVRALDAADGTGLWTFDPFQGSADRRARGVCRGLAHWKDGQRTRIFATALNRLYSIDAATGELDRRFGDSGSVDLTQDFDRDIEGLGFKHTSPVIVHEDLVITGGGGGEGPSPQAPGHIRGWDVRTGKRRWIFHTIPHPGEFGVETWPDDAYRRVGGTNDWSGMSIDRGRGIVFASTGSPSFDFYGGDRHGRNLFGNCVLALDVRTGERVWHFQTVHHDVWDYDLPCPPMLFAGEVNGKSADAVAQFTKTGLLF